MKTTLLLLICAGSLFAQTPRGTYVYEKTTSLSSSAEKVTLHLPSNSIRTAQPVAVTVYCTADVVATLSRDGTAPTATAGTAIKLNATNSSGAIPTASAVPYYSSNVGTSTTIKTYNIPGGVEYPISLGDKSLRPGENISLGTDSITGSCSIFFLWREN